MIQMCRLLTMGRVRGVGLFALAARRVKSQLGFEYAGSALGGIWHLIQPLSMIVIYAVVFGIFLRVQPEYSGISYGQNLFMQCVDPLDGIL